MTACIQANTTGMLTMAVHDISKISPPVLCKQLSIGCTRHLLHLGLFTLAHPADRYSIFSLSDDGGLFTSFTLFFFSVWGGDGFSVPTGQTDDREPHCMLCTAGESGRDTWAVFPGGHPRVQKKPPCKSNFG